MERIFLRRAASMLIVVSLLLTSFTGILFLGGETVRSETVLYDEDTTINEAKNMTNVIMTANLVIGQGGVVTVDHGSLMFSQSSYPGEQFTLIIEDGGKLILKNATLSTLLVNNERDFPSLGVMVRNNGTIEAYDSTLMFPGHMVVDNSNLVLWRSVIKGFDPAIIEDNCAESIFPSKVFATSPTLLFVSANVGIYDNSSIEDIYEPNAWNIEKNYVSTMYSHSYSFATDVNNASGSRQSVQYSLNRMPYDVPTNTTVMGETFTNLTTDDSTFYNVGGGLNLWLGGFDTAGLVFNASEGIAPVLSVKYKTDPGFPANGGYIFYQYRNGTVVRSSTQLHNTYDASSGTSKEVVATVNLPIMSAQDLYGLRIGYENVPTYSVAINKVWTTLNYDVPTYKNITLAGSTSLTLVDSYLGVDFTNDTLKHNQLVLTDNANAELYGVSVDTDQIVDPSASRLAPFVTIEKTMEVTPYSIGFNDTSAQNLGASTALDALYYNIASTNTVEFDEFNVSGLSGPIASAMMRISYLTNDVGGAYSSSGYVQFALADGQYKNTTIFVTRSDGVITSAQSLLPNDITIQQIGDLNVKMAKDQIGGTLRIDKLWMDVSLRPTVHIYRWADITAVDTQALPVNGAAISFTNPTPAYYVSGQAQDIPPAEVLRYLGVNAADFLKTNASGKAVIPLLSDTIYQTSSNPNSRPTSTYNVVLSYVKDTIPYYGYANVSFMSPYLNLDPIYMRSAANILINNLVLDLPDLYIGPITVTPSPAYAGMGLDIQVVIGNQGNTAVSNLEVVITGLLNGTEPSFNYTTYLNVVLAGGSSIAQTQWLGVPEGLHNVAVTIDPNNTIPEVAGGKNDNKRSQPVNVLPNLPELSISSSDIEFVGPSPSTSSPVTAVITVHNDGRAAANDVLVQVYVAGDKNSGQLVYTTHLTVGQGASSDAIASWKPNLVGTYPVYVYINADGKVIEYSYENNNASTTITVSLVSDPSDWLFDGTPAHANRTLPSTTQPFEVWTNLTIENYGSLTLDGTKMSISQSGTFSLQVTVRDNGVLILKNGAQLSSNYDMRLYILGNGKLIVESSSILSKVQMQADDNSIIEIESSNIGADLVTPDTSHATITAANTTFGTAWSLFGGYAQAELTNVTMPSMKAYGQAVINHYRWIVANVVDGNMMPLQNAYVEVNHITEGISYSGYTDAKGKVVFRAICDVYAGGQTTQNLGSYLLNTTFTYQGTEYDGAEPSYPVSLKNFTAAPYAVVSVVKMQVPGALPDLDPPLIISNTSPLRNETVTVSTEVSNVGVVPAYNVLVLFNDTGATFYSKQIAVVNPGETVYVSTTWRAWYPLGPHNISVVIDPYGAISEMSATNNMNYTYVTVLGITDLSVARADVTLNPYAPVIDTSINISATVRNAGDISANNVLVSFYAQSTAPGAPELLLAEQSIELIGVGGFGMAGASWTPGLAGNYNIRIAIDGVTSLTFVQNVLDNADLTPTYILFTPASPVVVNTNVRVDAAIANIGQIAAYNLVVRFYVGETTTGTLIGTTIVPVIAAGETKVVSVTWSANISNGLKTQDLPITVWVNPQQLIAEMRYDNNIASQTLRVNEVRADIFFPENIIITTSGTVVTHASQGERIQIATNVSNSGNTPALGAKIVFYVRDADNKTTVLGTVLKNVGVGENVNVLTNWTIDVVKGNYTLLINANPDNIIDESNTTNDQVSIAFVVEAPNLGLTLNPLGAQSYAPDSNIFVSGRVYNKNTTDPLSGVTINVYLAQGGERKTADFPATSDLSGNFAAIVFIPNGLEGAYQVIAVASNSDKSTSSLSDITVKSLAETGVPWYVYLLILVCIAVVIVGFSAYLYKYGLGKMVECGECGALIPESSRRCPKCGVEFEVGTAKCSECSAWIPSNSTSCPECNAKFISEAIEEEEDAYLKKMRGQYEAYVETFRDEARRVLGKKYHDGKFSDWWRKQPSYISFENWLAQEESKRKSGGVACPSCGTLNPRGASICHKCGSVIEVLKSDLQRADEQKQEEKAKPLRRIVRRPVEKKAAPNQEEPKPAEDLKPEENKPQN